MKAMAEKKFGGKAPEFLKLYPTDTPEKTMRSATDYAGDTFIAFSTWAWIEAQGKTGKHVIYRYRFDLAPPPRVRRLRNWAHITPPKSNTCSGNSTPRPASHGGPKTAPLSEQMMKYWAISQRMETPTAPACRSGRVRIHRRMARHVPDRQTRSAQGRPARSLSVPGISLEEITFPETRPLAFSSCHPERRRSRREGPYVGV